MEWVRVEVEEGDSVRLSALSGGRPIEPEDEGMPWARLAWERGE